VDVNSPGLEAFKMGRIVRPGDDAGQRDEAVENTPRERAEVVLEGEIGGLGMQPVRAHEVESGQATVRPSPVLAQGH
jgi:hypothetical protein